MGMPVPVVLDSTDAHWLRAVLVDSRWPVASFAVVERVTQAISHALDVDDDEGDDLPPITPQSEIGLEAFARDE